MISFCVASQTDTITLVSYNVLNFPDGRNDCGTNTIVPNRSDTLRKILGYLQPDIFVACEVQNKAGADSILSRSLNVFGESNYAMATFSSGGSLNNSMYYNTEKLTLQHHYIVESSPRVIDHYVLYVNDPNLGTYFDTTFVEVYMCHLKAGSGGTNVDLRAEQTEILMSYIANRPLDRNHFVCGDLNVYTSSEAGYQNLISGTFGLQDPINKPGNWNNNSSFANEHTQSTRNNQNLDCGAQGGLDDRFDQILVSANVMQGSDSLSYLQGSYDAVGNDGNHFNSNLLATPTNTEYPDSVVRALYYMSDHLPVALKAVVTYPTSNGLALYPEVKRISCYGGTDGEGTIVANAGQPPYTYLWGNNANNQTTATAFNLSSDIYCVQVTDALGEIDNYCMFVSQPDSLSYSLFRQPDNGNCDGSASLVLGGATEPFTVSWDDPMNQTGPSAFDLCGGNYTATVTDGNGCEYIIEVEISGGTNSIIDYNYKGLKVYPNPANNFIILSGLNGVKPANIACISTLGQVFQLNEPVISKENSVLDVSKLEPGLYFLKIQLTDEVITLRFIRK